MGRVAEGFVMVGLYWWSCVMGLVWEKKIIGRRFFCEVLRNLLFGVLRCCLEFIGSFCSLNELEVIIQS